MKVNTVQNGVTFCLSNRHNIIILNLPSVVLGMDVFDHILYETTVVKSSVVDTYFLGKCWRYSFEIDLVMNRFTHSFWLSAILGLF